MNGIFLKDLLIDPRTKEPLLYNEDSDAVISSKSGNNYHSVKSVPRIIPDDCKKIIISDLHQRYKSEFNYTDHYQKDAELFDYSETEVSGVTKNELVRLRESILNEITSDHVIILDVGCGNGWISKKLIPLNKKVISMDISSINPINAIRQMPHPNHAGLIADVYNIPLRENSIDFIVASEILEHVPDPGEFITNLVKLLNDKGKLVITVPYKEKLEYFLCVHCNKPTPKHAHLHSFDEQKLRDIIPEEGIVWSTIKLNNKFIFKYRIYLFLKYLPFFIWKNIDRIFNRIFDQPTRIQIVIQKIS